MIKLVKAFSWLFIVIGTIASYAMDGEDFSVFISPETKSLTKKYLFAQIIMAAQNNDVEEIFLEFEINLEGTHKKTINLHKIPYTVITMKNIEIWIPSDSLANIKGLMESSSSTLETELSYWEYYRYTGNDDTGILWILERSSKDGTNKHVIIKNK